MDVFANIIYICRFIMHNYFIIIIMQKFQRHQFFITIAHHYIKFVTNTNSTISQQFTRSTTVYHRSSVSSVKPTTISVSSVIQPPQGGLIHSVCRRVYVPYSRNLLREEIFLNLVILLSEEIFAIFKFNYQLCIQSGQYESKNICQLLFLLRPFHSQNSQH